MKQTKWTRANTSTITKTKLAKGNYSLLRGFKPLSKLSDKAIRQLARIVAEDLNRLTLDYSLQKYHFNADKIRLGMAFEHYGRKYSISAKELDKFKAYLLLRACHPSPYSADEWEKCATMIENVIGGRKLHEQSKPLCHKIKKVDRISDVDGFTSFLRRIVDCINGEINPNGLKDRRRYKEDTFRLASCLLRKFGQINPTICLTPEQIKARITKDLPMVKK